MSQFKTKLFAITGVVLPLIFLNTSFANENWTGFVPPSNDNNLKQKSHKNWRSGSNFNISKRFNYIHVSSAEAENNKYAFTEPTRKSVNPWKVNQFSSKHYGFGPTKRPWGSVPEDIQRRTKRQNYNGQNNRPQHNDNDFVAQRPLFRPYVNNRLVSHSNSLLPVGGYLPIYSNPGFINSNPFMRFNPGYGSPYLWR